METPPVVYNGLRWGNTVTARKHARAYMATTGFGIFAFALKESPKIATAHVVVILIVI